MPSLNHFIDPSQHDAHPVGPIGGRRPPRRVPKARIALLGLALWVAGGAAGCGGGGGGPEAPEQKEKQGVVQDKMKEFMKKSKLPNNAR
jgi:hypothetical protein